jgi:predicted DNA-binding ribbon-helix-helix protein
MIFRPGHGGQKSRVEKRSIAIERRKTSISLEAEFWEAFKSIAAARNVTIGDLVATLDRDRENINLSSTIRVFVLDHYRLTMPPKLRRRRGPK